MTTVAAKVSTGEIAADTMVSDDETFYSASKLRIGKDCIYGACGTWKHIITAFNAMETGAKEWDSESDIEVLELRADGIYIYDGTPIPFKILNDFWAVGSGAPFAIAAMELGLSPLKAVEIACKYDVGSRGPIEHYKLEGEIAKASSNRRRSNRGVPKVR